MKVLNLYAGIGGNRKLWQDVEVTAVEINPQIAEIYSEYFPNDVMIVGDAHEYLKKHYSEFDFIWSSPPCQTHSLAMLWRRKTLENVRYPDFKLYQEIIFLQYFAGSASWCVENVVPYYEPLIAPSSVIGRHAIWSNFYLNPRVNTTEGKGIFDIVGGQIYGFDLRNRKVNERKDKILRSCVNPEVGKYIFDRMLRSHEENQLGIFS